MQQDYRAIYDAPSKAAKVSFINTLSAWMGQENVSQRALSQMIGYSGVSTSEFLRQPETTPENFIRAVSLAVPELAGEYIRFRLAADAAFYKTANEQAEAREMYGRLQSRSDLLRAIDEAGQDILMIMSRLKSRVGV